MKNYIQVGKVVNTHGIKGEIKIIPLTDDNKRFEELKSIYIEDENEEFFIEKVWYKKSNVMLKLKGYDDINDVLKFKDKFILIDKKDSIDLEPDTYFIYNIIGMNVFLKDGTSVGQVKEVLQPGANDVYVIKGDKKEYLIPAVKDIVLSVDIESNKIIIDPIEGMIE